MKAFPSENNADNQYNWINQGMDLRDYFAAKAMQAIISSLPNEDIFPGEQKIKEVATSAYLYADTMMAEKLHWQE